MREQGTIFLGGPPLVKAATGEEVTAEELGGGDVHARTCGVADHLADDDEHALQIVRRIVATLAPRGAPPWERAPRRAAGRRSARALRRRPARPAHSPTTCARSSRASSTARASTSSRQLYGTTLVTGFAHIHGHPVGIVANNGILFSRVAR